MKNAPNMTKWAWPLSHGDGLIREQFRVVCVGAGRIPGGQAATLLELANVRGQLEAELASDRYPSNQPPLAFGDVVEVRASLLQSTNLQEPCAPRVGIQKLRLLDPDEVSFEALLPLSWVAPAHLPALTVLVQSLNTLSHRHVRRFIVDTLLNPNTALGLLTVPASCKHHHAYPGGLLDHTVDMLLDFERSRPSDLDPIVQDVVRAMVVVHDIGKTVTHVSGTFTARGQWQPHEPAGLELLASPLATLERNAPGIANLIRAMFKPPKYHPKKRHQLHYLVSRLDRDSANRKPFYLQSLKDIHRALSH